ncbi:Nn.00g020700.m01.CDS01 [Neocucurbitaria sp. VM-36]
MDKIMNVGGHVDDLTPEDLAKFQHKMKTTMNAADQAGLLTKLKLMNKYKSLIISEARAIFLARYSAADAVYATSDDYDVVIEKLSADGKDFYRSRVIMYKDDRSEWKMLLDDLGTTTVESLANLLDRLFERAYCKRMVLDEGEVYRGE